MASYRIFLALAAFACGDGSDVVLGTKGEYDPCASKVCGDPCFGRCPPNDPTCVETAELKWCDSSAKGRGQQPAC
jgi:hypothetical protein